MTLPASKLFPTSDGTSAKLSRRGAACCAALQMQVDAAEPVRFLESTPAVPSGHLNALLAPTRQQAAYRLTRTILISSPLHRFRERQITLFRSFYEVARAVLPVPATFSSSRRKPSTGFDYPITEIGHPGIRLESIRQLALGLPPSATKR